MKSLNLSGSQAAIVIKSLRERLKDFDDELDILESRIHEINNKKNELTSLLSELGSSAQAIDAPKKRGRKPGVKKAVELTTAPKKRGRKPKLKTETAIPAAPKKRGRKPGSKNVKTTAAASPKVSAEAPKKRGRKPGVKKVATKTPVVKTGKKRGRKPGVKNAPKKVTTVKTENEAAPASAAKKSSAKPAVSKKEVKKVAKKAAKKTSVKKVTVKKAEAPKTLKKMATAKTATKGKRGRKNGGEETLASKIVNVITEAKKGLSTGEIVDTIQHRFGGDTDKRKLTQAISSTLISLTKRGKIKREKANDQILNNII